MTSTSALRRSLQRFAVVAALGMGGASAIAATGAVPVTVAETPVEVALPVTSQSTQSFANPLYTVPAGKMLIVDSVSLLSQSLSQTTPLSAVLLSRDANFNILSIAGIVAAAQASGPAALTQPMHMHVLAGNALVANLFVGSGTVNAYIALSGHLVDAP